METNKICNQNDFVTTCINSHSNLFHTRSRKVISHFMFHIFVNISKTLRNLDTKNLLTVFILNWSQSSVLLYDLLVSLHPLHFCFIHINLYAHNTLYIFAILCISFILGFSFWQVTLEGVWRLPWSSSSSGLEFLFGMVI